MELKFVNNSYFKQLFQNLRPKLQYFSNRIFVTSHFGTLLLFNKVLESLQDDDKLGVIWIAFVFSLT